MIINLFIAAIAASIVGSGAAAPTANNATEAHHTLERRLYVEHLSMGGLFTNSDRSFSMEFNGRVQLWQDAGWNKIDFARTDYNNERWRIPNSSNCYGVVNPNDRKVVIVPCYSGGSYGWGTQWYPMPIGNDVYMYRNAHATDSWGQGQLCLDSAGWPWNGAQPHLWPCDRNNGNQHWYPYWADVGLEPGPIRRPRKN